MQILNNKNKNTYNCNLIDVSDNNMVGILLNRSISLITTIYSCFKNRITYLPLDPDWPNQRINDIVSANNLNMIITTVENYNRVKCPNKIIVDKKSNVNFFGEIRENEISYILYTSGSTGQPKGVEVKRESLYNFIDGVSEIIDFSPLKRIACFTTVSFDIFFLESVMALEKGLTVVLANEDEQRNPKLMANLIQNSHIDMIQMTPSMMQMLLLYDKELFCLKHVQEIMIGGEPFPLNLLQALQKKTSAKIYNMYGPTETTIWSTVSELTHKKRIDIGRPIKNTEIYIVDEKLSILPSGQVGEICVAGAGLAKGYLGRDELTNESFLFLPQKPEIRIYRTGDFGRYLPEGDLEYLGRKDNQVKIRGHRIELEEIESFINQYDHINQSIVILLEVNRDDKILQAFYTSDNYIDQKKISNYLRTKLPEYMIPTVYKRVEYFIQTSNGKIDRKNVMECIEMEVDKPLPGDTNVDNLNDIQKKAFNTIISNLGLIVDGNISLETVFTDIGLDSITFVKIIVDLENEFKFEFDHEKLLLNEFTTVKSMIGYIESKISDIHGTI